MDTHPLKPPYVNFSGLGVLISSDGHLGLPLLLSLFSNECTLLVAMNGTHTLAYQCCLFRCSWKWMAQQGYAYCTDVWHVSSEVTSELAILFTYNH